MACAPLIKLPTPQTLGLPEKFSAWRPVQEDMLGVTVTSPKRFKVLCASTGCGKSPVAVAAALMSGKPTCIVTETKSLQQQYLDDFKSIGMVSLMGKANYKCDMRSDDPDYSCEDGIAARCPYRGTVNCPASQAEIEAASSPLVVTNYAKWTSSRLFGLGMAHFQQVIFDEGSNLPDALSSALQIQLGAREVNDGLQVDFPSQVDSLQVWKDWASDTHGMAETAMMAAQARINGIPNPKTTWVKHYVHMRNLTKRLAILKIMKVSEWVVDSYDKGYQFDPIHPARYAESTILFKVPSILVVSATVRTKTMGIIGVSAAEYDFKEFDGGFNAKRCPVYYVPVMRVDYRSGSLEQVWLRMDQIAAKRRDRNGIVHTVSYERRDEVLRCSRYAHSMITNEKGEPVADAIEHFKSIYPGAILVSPSIEAGYDFPMKASEWQFLCKIPFDSPSAIGKARQAGDPEYGAYNAMQRLVQIFGRDVRSKEDQCVGPDTKVLTADLRWVKASELEVGSRLLSVSECGDGFDRKNRGNPRHWVWAIVERKSDVIAPRLKITYDGGEIVCTPEHPFLECIKKHRIAEWIAADQLKPGTKLIRLLPVWGNPSSFVEGWLSGFTDGEGCLSWASKRNPHVGIVTINQNPGRALAEVLWSLRHLEFQFDYTGNKKCKTVRLHGGFSEMLRFLGQIRPVRLVEKFLSVDRGERVRAIAYPRVISVEPLEPGPIVRLGTSSHTYLTDGLVSHNSEGFITDSHMDWFWPKYAHLAPKSFIRRLRSSVSLPPPLERLS